MVKSSRCNRAEPLYDASFPLGEMMKLRPVRFIVTSPSLNGTADRKAPPKQQTIWARLGNLRHRDANESATRQ